jgi:hypothetical protein
MTHYEMPARPSYTWRFRAASAIFIALFLALLCFSLWAPDTFSDGTRKEIGFAALGAIVLAMAGGMWLGVKEQSRQRERGFSVELSDGKISQRNDAGVVVVIDLARIDSIQESSSGWLIVRGVGSEEAIGIPRNIFGFDEIKRELLAHHAIEPRGVLAYGRIIVPLLLAAGIGTMLFASHSRAVTLSIGGAAVLLQAIWTAVVLRKSRSRTDATAMAVLSVLVLVICCWVLYERAIPR